MPEYSSFFHSWDDSDNKRFKRHLPFPDINEGTVRYLRKIQEPKATKNDDVNNPCFCCLSARRKLREGELEPAFNYAQQAVEHCGDWGSLLTLAAVWDEVAKLGDGSTDKLPWLAMVAILKKALRKDPSLALAWRKLADVYRKLDYLPTALRYYKKAERLDPTDIKTLEGMGLTLKLLGNGTYREILEKALALDNYSLVARQNLHV